MILNLYSSFEDFKESSRNNFSTTEVYNESAKNFIDMPNIVLDENKNYEFGILNAGGALQSSFTTPRIMEIKYNGIKAMSGPNPYTISFQLLRTAFNFAPGNIIYHPLRTNQLGATRLKFEVLNAASEFFHLFIQIEIREQK